MLRTAGDVLRSLNDDDYIFQKFRVVNIGSSDRRPLKESPS